MGNIVVLDASDRFARPVEIPSRPWRRRRSGARIPGSVYAVLHMGRSLCGRVPFAIPDNPESDRQITAIRLLTPWSGRAEGDEVCRYAMPECKICPGGGAGVSDKYGQCFLAWVSWIIYPTVEEFLDDTRSTLSIRLRRVPPAMVPGSSLIALAHSRAIAPGAEPGARSKAGIFKIMRLDSMEYIVTGDETDSELRAMLERNIHPVRDEPNPDPACPLFPCPYGPDLPVMPRTPPAPDAIK